jgi:hypothetical protein
VDNFAEITLNGIARGVAWLAPYHVDVTATLGPGTSRRDESTRTSALEKGPKTWP